MNTRIGFLAISACIVLHVTSPAVAGPIFINLRPVLNSAWEDDGISGNGAGGWSDEGVNDMYLWPPIPTGRGPHNGFPFEIVDPVSNNGKGVLMLNGKRIKRAGLPKQVDVAVPQATGRYIYLLMNSVLSTADNTDLNPLVFTATLCYADGSTHDFPVREGFEIASWWTNAKTPFQQPPVLSLVHLGENIIAAGRFRVGLWATRMENPTPQKPVTNLRFRSNGKSVACIFAATLSDEDYSSAATLPKASLPPDNPPPPPGYFDKKSQQQHDALYAAMRAGGFAQGVRTSTVLRADMVAMTFDNALTRDSGYSYSTNRSVNNATVRFHEPSLWTITSTDDLDYKGGKRPVEIGHKCYERYSGDVGLITMQSLYWNDYFVRFPTAMKPGRHYTVTVAGMDTGMIDHIDIAYDDKVTISHAIKVNQIGYSLTGKERWAYLGYWAGSLGAIDYAAFPSFEVVKEANGQSVKQGKIELRAAADLPSGENVYQLDLSGIPAGRYYVVVHGVGRSESFRIGADATAEAAYHCFRAFFHQRCGQELKPPYSPDHKPACHVEFWESGFLVNDPNFPYTPKLGEAKRSFSGGYHDAGDYFVTIVDNQGIADALMVYETNPEFFTDGQFNLPESGQGIPDILSEAKWAVKFWMENQYEDGNVPDGRGPDNDGWWIVLNDLHKRYPFGIIPSCNQSAPIYASEAAELSTLIRKYDPALADRLIKSARKALDYALQFKPEPYPIPQDVDPKTKQIKSNLVEYAVIMCALGECYRATGEPKLADKLNELYFGNRADGKFDPEHGYFPVTKAPVTVNWPYIDPRNYWPLVRKGPNPLPPNIADKARAILLCLANETLKKTYESAYRLGTGKYDKTAAWGGASAGHFGDLLARAHALTGDQKYLDALALNYDYHFGVNPPAKTFVTGMGWNPPQRPEISRFHYYKWKAAHPDEHPLANGGPPSLENTTIPGITIYGLGPALGWYYPTANDPGGPWPNMHCRRDLWGGSETWNEFTLHQVIGPVATMTLYLAAQDASMVAKSR